MMRPHDLDATRAAALIASGKLTSAALVSSCLERIAEREATIGAWEHLDPDHAMAQARERDRSRPLGPLHGIPVGVKDILATIDQPTGCGSPIYRGAPSACDAACVAALRAAGAVIMGKTVTTEFATYHPGRTTNPRNPAHTPGGSSSGSAAAVADRMVPLALGTQTGGSIIRPASFCGVIGYKPTFGYVSRAGMKLLAEPLDTIGVFARSVSDAALALAVLSGRPELATVAMPTVPPRVGLCRTPQWPFAEAATRRAMAFASETLAAAGATIVEIDLPHAFHGLAEAQARVMAYQAARALAWEQLHHAARLSPAIMELIRTGHACPPADYDQAGKLAGECRAALPELVGGLDMLLAPSVPGEAPHGLTSTGDPIFNRIWTLLHAPCLNIPAVDGPNGLPVGVQVIGPAGSDTRTLAMARWTEQVLAQAV